VASEMPSVRPDASRILRQGRAAGRRGCGGRHAGFLRGHPAAREPQRTVGYVVSLPQAAVVE
jgi:hypothetical protein